MQNDAKTHLDDNTPRLIGRSEAAAYCGITPTCFSMWVSSHKMPPAIPGTRKWDKKAIDAKLDEISGLVGINGAVVDEFAKWEREYDARKSGRTGLTDLQKWRRERDARRAAGK